MVFKLLCTKSPGGLIKVTEAQLLKSPCDSPAPYAGELLYLINSTTHIYAATDLEGDSRVSGAVQAAYKHYFSGNSLEQIIYFPHVIDEDRLQERLSKFPEVTQPSGEQEKRSLCVGL